MRKIKENELEQAAQKMLEIFFDTLDISITIKGIDTEKAKKVIYESLYWDMVYYSKYGDVFTYDDDFSGIIFLIDGKHHSFFKQAIISLKAGKKTRAVLNKEEVKIFATNSRKVQAVHSFNWYKKRENVPYYLAHMGIDKGKRGTGIFRKMMEFTFDYVKKYNTEIAIETFVPENASIYEHMGFELVEAVESEDKTFKEYRMIKEL